MLSIVKTLCENMLTEGFVGRSILLRIGAAALASLLAEVDDEPLRGKVLRMAVAAAKADQHRSDGEASILDAIRRNWGMRQVTITG